MSICFISPMWQFIPVVILILPFIFVIFMVLIKSNERYRRDQLKADLYLKALEKGVALPESLFGNEKKKKYNSLKIAILMISIGIGISLFQLLIIDSGNYIRDMAGGLIPICLGIGFLIVHIVWKKQGLEDEE